ncbi:MAG TPA: DUF1259 domain-containing protein, partial [Kofleriaceae bacterium]|nr:DUF1259 domain-containing protein [Kofleriaceae bacterium]
GPPSPATAAAAPASPAPAPAASPAPPPPRPAAPLDAGALAAALGAELKEQPGGVLKASWPRKEVKVSVDGVPLAPPAGLSSWAAFQPTADGAMLMGDTVVFEDEVSPAIDAAFASGLEVTALHNHFFFDRPKVYFMHIGGHGDGARLAAGVKAVWDAVKAVRAARKSPADRFGGARVAKGTLDAGALEAALGHPLEVSGGVAKATIGREGTMHGVRVGGPMGLTTWIAFSGSDAGAAVSGDLIMTAEEVQPVLRALRQNGLHVVALHNHMVGGEPFFYFVHFWGKGKAIDLAAGFKKVLEAQAR